MTRRIDEYGFMHTELSNISKEQVRPYLGSEIANRAADAGITVEPERKYYLYCPAGALKESAEQWNGMQLKLEHCYGDAEDPDKEHWIGSVYNAEFAAPYLKACLTINDGEAQELLEQGAYEELSASYLFDLVNKPGKFDGVEYDFEMANIRPNHVAMVPKGRAGRECCVADEDNINDEGVKYMDILDKILALIQGVKAGEAEPAVDEQDVPPQLLTRSPPLIRSLPNGLKQPLASRARHRPLRMKTVTSRTKPRPWTPR